MTAPPHKTFQRRLVIGKWKVWLLIALGILGALQIEALVFVPTMAIGMLLAQRFFGADR